MKIPRSLPVVIVASVALYIFLRIHDDLMGFGIFGNTTLNIIQIALSWPLFVATQLVLPYFVARFTKIRGWCAGALFGVLPIVPATFNLIENFNSISSFEGGVLTYSRPLEAFSWAISFVVAGAVAGIAGEAHRQPKGKHKENAA